MTRVIRAKIELRTDVAANWTTANPVLRAGEPGVESNSNRIKIGDGVTAWNDLDYLADTHVIADVTGLQAALDGKQTVLGYTPYDSANPEGYITSAALSTYATTASVADGYQPLAAVLTNTTASFTTEQETKLNGIAPGATVNVPPQIDIFTANGTWTKPTNAKVVEVILVGGGAGGNSGRRGATSTARSGGAGGQGGGYARRVIPADSLTSTVAVTVGTGGPGAPAITVDTTDGSQGTNGGNSSFGSYLRADGGSRRLSNAGTANITEAAYQGWADTGGGPNGATSVTAAPAAPTYQRGPSAGGGAGGGSITSGNALFAGAVGGASGGGTAGAATGGTAGTSGTPTGGNGGGFDTTNPWGGGAGGGGGYPSSTSAAGAGGNGGFPGGGGGGGGASLNGFNSGAGGAGASGVVVVYTYF